MSEWINNRFSNLTAGDLADAIDALCDHLGVRLQHCYRGYGEGKEYRVVKEEDAND